MGAGVSKRSFRPYFGNLQRVSRLFCGTVKAVEGLFRIISLEASACLEKHNNPTRLQPTFKPISLNFRWQLWGWAPFYFPSLIFSLDLTGIWYNQLG